ncbi:STAS domain-containing protein [Streptomyces sp. NPDC003015]
MSGERARTTPSLGKRRDRLSLPAPDRIVIDLSAAHVWDASSVAALDAIETKYAQSGKTVEIIGLNDPSADLHGKFTGKLASH